MYMLMLTLLLFLFLQNGTFYWFPFILGKFSVIPKTLDRSVCVDVQLIWALDVIQVETIHIHCTYTYKYTDTKLAN